MTPAELDEQRTEVADHLGVPPWVLGVGRRYRFTWRARRLVRIARRRWRRARQGHA